MNSYTSHLQIGSLYRYCSLSRRKICILNKHFCASTNAKEFVDSEMSAEEAEERRQLLQQKRNKSRLEPHHYNQLHGLPTPISPLECDVTPLADVRAKYGREGAGSNIHHKYLWPTNQEMLLIKEYEQVAFPLSFPEMIAKAKKDKQDQIQFIINRQRSIHNNLKSLEKWKESVRSKVTQKEEEARVAKEKREKVMEEVRLIYGMRLDPNDEKFKEILAVKEEEERKAQKALKKQQKQQKLVDQMRRLAEAHKQKLVAAAAAAAAAESATASAPTTDSDPVEK